MDRLTEADWLDHALKVLRTKGFTALKADPLAKALGVSRGSFYWHFRDLDDFQRRVLDRWEETSTRAVIERMEKLDQEKNKLFELMVTALDSTDHQQLDRAVRSWAQSNADLQKRLVSVDRLRLGYLTKLLLESGMRPRDAKMRARLIYAASLGDSLISAGAAPQLKSAQISELAKLLSR